MHSSARPELTALAHNLRAARKKSQITQSKLAEMAGIQRPYLGMIERGTANPSILKLANLADALGVTVVDLLAQTTAIN